MSEYSSSDRRDDSSVHSLSSGRNISASSADPGMQVPHCLRVGEPVSRGFDGRNKRATSPFRGGDLNTRLRLAEMFVPSHIRPAGGGRYEEVTGGPLPPELEFEQKQKSRREMAHPRSPVSSGNRCHAEETVHDASSESTSHHALVTNTGRNTRTFPSARSSMCVSSIVSEERDDTDGSPTPPISPSSSSLSDASRQQQVLTPRPVALSARRGVNRKRSRHRGDSMPPSGGLWEWVDQQRRQMTTSEVVCYSMGVSYVVLKLVSWLVRRMIG